MAGLRRGLGPERALQQGPRLALHPPAVDAQQHHEIHAEAFECDRNRMCDRAVAKARRDDPAANAAIPASTGEARSGINRRCKCRDAQLSKKMVITRVAMLCAAPISASWLESIASIMNESSQVPRVQSPNAIKASPARPWPWSSVNNGEVTRPHTMFSTSAQAIGRTATTSHRRSGRRATVRRTPTSRSAGYQRGVRCAWRLAAPRTGRIVALEPRVDRQLHAR